MTYEHYKTLGVSPDTTDAEIKKAYLLAVRQHHNDEKPDELVRINAAWAILGDSQSRSQYDASERYGDQVNEYLSQAAEASKGEDWAEAIRQLKQALALDKTRADARSDLGHCFLHNGQLDEATQTFSWLTRKHPDVADYWVSLGRVHRKNLDEAGDDASTKSQALVSARECFSRAVELEPHHSDARLRLAKVMTDQGEYEEALKHCEKTIQGEGRLDWRDMDAFFQICSIHWRRDELKAITDTAQRLRSLCDDIPAAQEEAAEYFTDVGHTLFEIGDYASAVCFVDAAMLFAQSDAAKRLLELRTHFQTVQRSLASRESFIKDSQIIEPLHNIGSIVIAEAATGQEAPDWDALEEHLDALEEYPNKVVLISLARLKAQYGSIYRLNPALFDEIDQVVRKELDFESEVAPMPQSVAVAMPSPEQNVIAAPKPLPLIVVAETPTALLPAQQNDVDHDADYREPLLPSVAGKLAEMGTAVFAVIGGLVGAAIGSGVGCFVGLIVGAVLGTVVGGSLIYVLIVGLLAGLGSILGGTFYQGAGSGIGVFLGLIAASVLIMHGLRSSRLPSKAFVVKLCGALIVGFFILVGINSLFVGSSKEAGTSEVSSSTVASPDTTAVQSDSSKPSSSPSDTTTPADNAVGSNTGTNDAAPSDTSSDTSASPSTVGASSDSSNTDAPPSSDTPDSTADSSRDGSAGDANNGMASNDGSAATNSQTSSSGGINPLEATASPGSTLNNDPLPVSVLQGRLITDADLQNHSLAAISVSRNLIYAIHGYIFKRVAMQNLFSSTSWYRANPNFSEAELSPIEKANALTIRHFEQTHFGY